jgi:hypothetical protein
MKGAFKLILVPYKAEKLEVGMYYKWNLELGEEPDKIDILKKNDLNNSAIQEEAPDMLFKPYLVSEKESIIVFPEQIGTVHEKDINIKQLQEIVNNYGHCKIELEYKNPLAKSLGKTPVLLDGKVIIHL